MRGRRDTGGLHMSASAVRTAPQPTQSDSRFPGLLLSLGVAAVAYLLGQVFPLIGGPVFGVLLGLAAGTALPIPRTYKPGLQFASKQVLQAAIVLMGFGLSMGQVLKTGSESLAVMLTTLAVCLVAARLLGRMLGVSDNLTALVGAGTGICGASAIAAVAPVVEADEREVAYAISTVFAFNIVAVLIFPAMGHLFGFSQQAFGLWAGTAINDTSSVVAAAYAFGTEAGAYATVVKLARATMIIPLALGLAAVRTFARQGTAAKVKMRKLIPWFILWFLGAALLRSGGLVPDVAAEWLPVLGRFCIVVALSAVGLSADLRAIARTGWRPLGLGAMLWILVAGTSLIVQHFVGQL